MRFMRRGGAKFAHPEKIQEKMDRKEKLAAMDVTAMTYKQLQAACKEFGLPAGGKAEVLREQLYTEGAKK